MFTWQEIHDRLQAFVDALDAGEGIADQPARYNIAPTQPIAVIYQSIDGPVTYKADLMRWGLVPHWVKDPSDFPVVFNARSETINEKPTFRGGLRHHRCIVPASGYYEWKRTTDGKKQPFYIRLENGEPMWFAGIYSTWLGPDGSEFDSTAIITVPANEDLVSVHDRMPAIIPDSQIADWLNPREVNEKTAKDMIAPAPRGQITFYPVSTRVNSGRVEGPDLIEEVTETLPEPKKSSGQGELF